MKLLPVALNLEGRRVLIVGGGPVAERKARACVECGALVRVVAPRLCDCFAPLQERIEHHARRYETGDAAGCDLVFACTDAPAVNAQIAAEARAAGSWCNRADESGNSDFHGAATVRRGAICVGISTAGGSPALARHLKGEVERAIGPEYEALLELMSARRGDFRLHGAQRERAELWRAVLHSDMLSLLRAGQDAAAAALLDELLNSREAGAARR